MKVDRKREYYRGIMVKTIRCLVYPIYIGYIAILASLPMTDKNVEYLTAAFAVTSCILVNLLNSCADYKHKWMRNIMMNVGSAYPLAVMFGLFQSLHVEFVQMEGIFSINIVYFAKLLPITVIVFTLVLELLNTTMIGHAIITDRVESAEARKRIKKSAGSGNKQNKRGA